MQGELAMARQDHHEALRIFKQVEARHPAYTGEIIEPLARCHAALGMSGEWQTHLRDQYSRHPSRTVMTAIARDLTHTESPGEALKFVAAHLDRRPSLRGLADLIGLRLEEQGKDRTDFIVLMNELVQRLTADMPVYQCQRCGFSVRTLHWQCPGCRAWGTMHHYSERKEKGASE